ncbi:MAG: SRPBCC family protein [Thermoplasmata archaeon]|nr:SRPBCC family protein [Thermoplasmata archaeon]
MVAYQDDDMFPAPPDVLWKLLDAHLDDSAIRRIHPLILSQRTLNRNGMETIVERTIDARGKSLKSKWKITYNRPQTARWEVFESEGPWAVGSYVVNRYSAAPGGTRIESRGDLKITVLPFFLPQKLVIRSVFGRLHNEDIAATRA